MGDEDVDGKCRMSACSSAKLFLFMVPLVLVSGFAFVNIGPKCPTPFLTSLSTTHISPPLLLSSPSLPPAPAPAPSPQAAKEVSLPTSALSTKVESVQVWEITQEYQIILFLFLHLCMSYFFFLFCGFCLFVFIYLFSNCTLYQQIFFLKISMFQITWSNHSHLFKTAN